MIIWNGKGIFPVLLLVVAFFVCLFTLPENLTMLSGPVALLVAAIYSVHFGHQWHSKKGTVYIEEETGRRLIHKEKHAIFWIRVE